MRSGGLYGLALGISHWGQMLSSYTVQVVSGRTHHFGLDPTHTPFTKAYPNYPH